MPSFEHLKTLHTLIGMGSAVLAAAVPYPRKVTQISCKDREVLKKMGEEKKLSLAGASGGICKKMQKTRDNNNNNDNNSFL